MLALLALLLIVSIGVMAQEPNGPVQFVTIGADGGIGFSPANITAPTNTIVTFLFDGSAGANHTVTQVTYDHPCVATFGGFSSPGNWTEVGSLSLQITDDTTPVWFACAHHCDLGEAGAINAPPFGVQTFDGFISGARASSSVGGFDSVPELGSPLGSGVGGATVVEADFAMGPPPSDTTDSGFVLPPVVTSVSSAPSDASSGLSSGEIAGITIGSILGVALVLGLMFWRQRVKARRAHARSEWMRRLEMSLRRGREKAAVDAPETKEDKITAV